MMATKGDREMYEVYVVYNVINSHIFVRTCRFCFHSEATVHGHEIFNPYPANVENMVSS